MVTPGNVPANVKFDERPMQFLYASPDLSHVVFSSPGVLTKNAIAANGVGPREGNLYEWAGGDLQLVNVLPNGEATAGDARLGRNNFLACWSRTVSQATGVSSYGHVET